MLAKLLEKWLCKHDWQTFRSVTRDTTTGKTKESRVIREILKCSKCGKFHEIHA